MAGKKFALLRIGMALIFLLSACSSLPNLGIGPLKKIDISIVYGSEKQEWLEALIKSFNNSNAKTADGSIVVVEGKAMGSIEAVDGILQQTIQPTVWSPASSMYLPVANAAWRKSHSDDLISGTPKDLVLSPVVITMWKPMAEALGWPNKAIGWADVSKLATSTQGWEAFGYPEWGSFKFGHTHPGYSNSGLVAVIAQVYAGAKKQRGLTLSDLKDPQLKAFVGGVQSSIIHYGTSTGFFGTRMFDNGPSYLSAAVMYENLVVAQETKRLAGQSSQLPVVAIYPSEGTFWANHPYGILNAPWVTAPQKEAAQVFLAYLLDKPQQTRAIELGFRPADLTIPLTTPLDAQHGVDPQQPKATVLEIPSAEIIQSVQDLWKEVKKPVDLVIAIDTSGSMSGQKIAAARTSLVEFIHLLDDRDRLQIITFSSKVNTLVPLASVGEKREDMIRRVSALVEGGETKLYDAVSLSFESLAKNADPHHIRAVVVMTDGQDTASSIQFRPLLDKIGPKNEGGNGIKLFTIGYGSDTDKDILTKMAEITGGRQYSSDPKTINQVYAEIATFF